MLIPQECKRLAEVDMPIIATSKYSAREKDIKTGNFSAIHVWWARRPLAACRAMNLACLLPDPADPNCLTELRKIIATSLDKFEREQYDKQSRLNVEKESWKEKDDGNLSASRNKPNRLRKRLLYFIGEYSNWELKDNLHWTKCAREMVIGCYEGNPTLLDSFAGGGSIPIEGRRIGAKAIGTDINPLPILINKLQLELLEELTEDVLKKTEEEVARINDVLSNELSSFYPDISKDWPGEVVIGYLCARTIRCEGIDCGIEFPLLTSPWVCRTKNVKVAYKYLKENGKLKIGLIEKPKPEDVPEDILNRGNAKCPICGHVTPVESVRRQLSNVRGGSKESQLVTLVTTPKEGQGRIFHIPRQIDIEARKRAEKYLLGLAKENADEIPQEKLPPKGSLGMGIQAYGMEEWGDLFTARQAITNLILIREIKTITDPLIKIILSLTASKFLDRNSTLCRWSPPLGKFIDAFGGSHRIQISWDFYEPVPFGRNGPNLTTTYINHIRGLRSASQPKEAIKGLASFGDATDHFLPDSSVDIWATDPPYYDSVPYSDISNYFIVWLKKIFPDIILEGNLAPKKREVVMDSSIVENDIIKDKKWYEKHVESALKEGLRITKPDGIAYWVYAHKSTEGWATVLKGIVNAGWTVTGSWPISTERKTRLRAHNSASLSTSVHIVMRPRSINAGVGHWSDILAALPERLSEWLKRMTQEGVVGADAIYSCIGPAMELYSQWETVEKADGTKVPLDTYLEIIWDTVANEAMKMIDPITGNHLIESDARFSIMVLWILRQSQETQLSETEDALTDYSDIEEITPISSEIVYDTASLLARGIGVDLDSLIEQKIILMKEKQNQKFVCLLTPAERRYYLLSTSNEKISIHTLKDKGVQLKLGEDLGKAKKRELAEKMQDGSIEIPIRESVLDQLHQAMLLHADGNTAALDQLINGVIGDNETTWQLALTLNTLYPEGSWERSKIEGVISRYHSIFRKR